MFFRRNPPLYSLFLLLTAGLISPSGLAARQGNGIVNMQGAIIDTACAIAAGDEQQTINLGVLPIASLASQGKGAAHAFSIHLTDCVLDRTEQPFTPWKGFQITFDGPGSGALFALQGKASGVSLRISDGAGNIASAGQPLPPQLISPGTMRLEYYLTPVINHNPLIAGNYFTTIRFKLDYF